MNHESIELNLRKRTPYFNLRDQLNEKRKIKRKLIQFNNFLNSYGLRFKSIDICPQTSQTDDFDLNIRQDTETVDKAALCQTARDLSLMSERAYLKFRETISPIAELPSLDKCNAFKKQINQIWPISVDEADVRDPEKIYNPSDSNKMGAFIAEPVEKIKFVCQKYLEKMKPPVIIEDNTFKIMICGDGLQITKTHLNLLNFCFTLLNKGDLSHKGFYTLGNNFTTKNLRHFHYKNCLKF
jgi:hypothetical protein